MTDNEIRIVRALKDVNFFPGSKSKSLVRSLNAQADSRPEKELTPAQRAAVLSIAVRFRRQVDPAIVDLAESEGGAA